MKNPTKANLGWEAKSPKLRAGAKEELLSDGQGENEI